MPTGTRSVGLGRSPRIKYRKDISAFVRTYGNVTSTRVKFDDQFGCPLRDLNLLVASPSGGYRLANERPASLPGAVVLTALLDHATMQPDAANTVSLARLATDPGAPGRAFRLTDTDLVDLIEPIVAQTDGLSLTAPAGAPQLGWSADPGGIAQTVIADYYGHDGDLPPIIGPEARARLRRLELLQLGMRARCTKHLDLMTTLADHISIDKTYGRSTNLERDTGTAAALDGYILTGRVLEMVDRITRSLNNGTGGAWSVTGPYGSGKSSLGVFLAALFGDEDSATYAHGPPTHRRISTLISLDRVVAVRARFDNAPFIDGLVTARSEPITHTVARALHRAALSLRQAAGQRAFPEIKLLNAALDDIANADPRRTGPIAGVTARRRQCTRTTCTAPDCHR